MTKSAFLDAFFEVDIVDIQIIELYSYHIYNEQEEERLLQLSALIVNNALLKLLSPPELPY